MKPSIIPIPLVLRWAGMAKLIVGELVDRLAWFCCRKCLWLFTRSSSVHTENISIHMLLVSCIIARGYINSLNYLHG